MKKLIRRMLASVLTVCMLLGMMPALAAEAPDPFALKGVESVTYTSGSHSLIVTDDATVKKVVAALVNSGAQKANINPNTPTGMSLLIKGEEWSYHYWTPASPDSDQKITELWVDGEGYRTKSDLRPVFTMLENQRKQLDPYGYFTWDQDQTCIGLLDNAARKATFVEIYERRTEILQLLQSIAPSKITAANQSELGKQRTGVSEMRIQIDSNSYSYQLYEKGLSVTKYTLDGANATEYFVCDASAIQKLADQMSKTYNEDSYKTSTWLAIINPARVKSLNVKFKEEKYQDNILSELYAQQMLDYLREIAVEEFLGTTTSVWKSPDAEFQLVFTSGISYRIQLLSGKMRIYASDMKQVLEYTTREVSVDRLIDYAKQLIQNQKDGEYKPNPSTAKPVIYLYPEKETEVSVQLNFNGTLTSVYPENPKNTTSSCAWKVTAAPDGTLTDAQGRNYRYLFWEGVADVDWKQESGFFVKAEDAREFLEEKLTILGLNDIEQNDFITYWLPVLQENGESFVTFTGKQYTDAAKLTVTPKPDSVLRVQMLISKVDDTNRAEFEKLPEQKLTSFERKGFVLVEWGGTSGLNPQTVSRFGKS